MRRGRLGGIGSVRREKAREKKFNKVGSEMASTKLEHVEEQLSLFRSNLEIFARKYKDNIREDPIFRREFQIMCAKIGVDPLASTKGFWAELLGVGTFYTELGVQIVDACVSTRAMNGGLIEVPALIATVKKMRGSNALDISSDDVERAVKQLRCLGSGFNIVQAGTRRMVVSIPVELNRDHSLLLYAAQEPGGYVTVPQMMKGDYCWSEERVKRALRIMLQNGMCWEDNPGLGLPIRFFFPSVWKSTLVGGSVVSGNVGGGSVEGGSVVSENVGSGNSGSGSGNSGETKNSSNTVKGSYDYYLEKFVNEGLDYLEIRNKLEKQFGETLSVQKRRQIKSKIQQRG
jgi:ESCRT-II complex subunit VPS22